METGVEPAMEAAMVDMVTEAATAATNEAGREVILRLWNDHDLDHFQNYLNSVSWI